MKQTLLSLLMMLLPLLANAEEVEIDGIYYNLINKGKAAEVKSGKSCTGEIVIPSSVVYNDVTYSVTSIGASAFSSCSSLTSVTIPNSVTSIGESAFGGCRGMTSITIPNSVTSIGKYAFSGCNSLTAVTIPNSVTSIGDYAFRECIGLSSVTIPNSVTDIGDYAFKDCSGLTSVTIHNSVASIGEYAFSGCRGLTAVYITDLDAWCKIEFAYIYSNPLYYAHHLYLNGKEVKDLVIPNSVTSIAQNAFEGCSGLTSITIPNSVTSIGDQAFYDCSGLTSVIIPNSVTSIGIIAFAGCSGLTSVTIPNSVTSIGERAFHGCNGLTSVTISNSVTDIGSSAFQSCRSLTSVNIPNSVTSIGESAFKYCSSLTSITIPNSVTSVGRQAFHGCSGLTSVTIGSGVKQIYEKAFAYCPELTDVYCYAENVPSTNTNAFEGSYIEFATLHVPASAVNAYSNTEPWSNFKNKVAMGEVKPSYTLTYMLDRKKYVEYSLQEGETIIPVPAPSKEGFTFSGWSEIPALMPDHDVTINGTFIANTYLPGDANGDGQITVTDIGVIVDIILGKTPANARKQQEEEPQ